MTSLFDLERFGSNIAIVQKDSELSYVDLARMADQLCETVGRRELAAIECDNHLSALAAFIGCQRKHVPTLLVDAGLGTELRRGLYEKFQVSLVFEAHSGAWLRLRKPVINLHADLALLLSTSGSTGSSKLVRLSHRNLAANAASIAQYLEIGVEDRAITSLPVHYSYGLSVVNSHLLRGASLALTDLAVTQRDFWTFMTSRRVSSLAGLPVMYDWLRRLRLDRMNCPDLKTLTQAGGRLSPDLVEWMADLADQKHWRFFVMYGQTEATARMAYLQPELARAHRESIGTADPRRSV